MPPGDGEQGALDVRRLYGLGQVFALVDVSCRPQELQVPPKHPVAVLTAGGGIGKVVLVDVVDNGGDQGEVVLSETLE